MNSTAAIPTTAQSTDSPITGKQWDGLAAAFPQVLEPETRDSYYAG
jgi:hypothetical protein